MTDLFGFLMTLAYLAIGFVVENFISRDRTGIPADLTTVLFWPIIVFTMLVILLIDKLENILKGD